MYFQFSHYFLVNITWSLIPYYSLFIEVENKSRFFGNGVDFWFCVWDFFLNAVEKNVRVTVILQVFFVFKSSVKIQRRIMGMGVDEMASSLHVGFFPELEIF